MAVKHCDVHKIYTVGCDNCKERSRNYQKNKAASVSHKRNGLDDAKVKHCNVHKIYTAGCDNCKEKTKTYQREKYIPVPRNLVRTKNAPIRYCDAHTKYTAGCPDCQERARTYQSERKPTKPIFSSIDPWARMTEIGLRWEKEGLI